MSELQESRDKLQRIKRALARTDLPLELRDRMKKTKELAIKAVIAREALEKRPDYQASRK